MKITETSVHPKIVQIVQDMGINELYPPQAEAILPALKGNNIVLSIPTASGKSLVAYITLAQQLLTKKGKAMYIVPLRALAREKYEDLQCLNSLGLKIALATGDLDDSDTRLGSYDIIVCTSEKADSLLRHKVGWISELSVLVLDEIHLIHDPSRGPTLEVIIAHIKALNPNTQLIALSATIKNALELSDWLEATLIQSDWRPVQLKEGVFFEGEIQFNDGATVAVEAEKKQILPQLVLDSIIGEGQVLVFVNNRRSTVSLAKQLIPTIKKTLSDTKVNQLAAHAEILEKDVSEITSVGKTLVHCVKHGVAFHHAGLNSIQRKCIEQGFKDHLIQCIVATPTLAAGVNIPARRVIIRDLWRYEGAMGMQPIPVLEYKQQAGRAGRPQYDTVGEAITIAKKQSQRDTIWYEYVLGDTEAIYSKLGSQPALRMHILSAIATGFASDDDTIMKFIESTFFAYQSDVYSYEKDIDDAIDFLVDNEFMDVEGSTFRPTLFGEKTSSLYIDPLSAVGLKTFLEEVSISRLTDFSYLYAVCATPDIRSLYLRRDDSWVEEKVEYCKDCLFPLPPTPSSSEYEWFLSDIKTASVMEDWITETSEDAIVNKYDIGPGDIHTLVENAQWLLHALREYARMYQFTLVPDISDLLLRVEYGCQKELLNLVQLRGIGRVRARSLYTAGFTSVNALRNVPVDRLAKIKSIGPTIARNIKQQLNEQNMVHRDLDEFRKG